jgi:hypothetical protein
VEYYGYRRKHTKGRNTNSLMWLLKNDFRKQFFEWQSKKWTINSYGKMKFPAQTATVKSPIGFFLDPAHLTTETFQFTYPACKSKHTSVANVKVKNVWSSSSISSCHHGHHWYLTLTHRHICISKDIKVKVKFSRYRPKSALGDPKVNASGFSRLSALWRW